MPSGPGLRPIIPPRLREDTEYRGETFIGSGETTEDAVDRAVGLYNEWFRYQPKYTSDGTPCHTFTSTLTYTDGAMWSWTYVLFVSGPMRDVPAPATGATVRLDQ